MVQSTKKKHFTIRWNTPSTACNILRKTTQHDERLNQQLAISWEKPPNAVIHSISNLQYPEKIHPIWWNTQSTAYNILRESTLCEKTLDQQLALSWKKPPNTVKHSINSLQYPKKNHPIRKTTRLPACNILRKPPNSKKNIRSTAEMSNENHQ